ncbi:hypothetical protein B0H21DRAFT_372439 [Amylocystis lapponica]|nr:hypothetical protein B0H21DRAFT_372439 [Amylocystis lapponica]
MFILGASWTSGRPCVVRMYFFFIASLLRLSSAPWPSDPSPHPDGTGIVRIQDQRGTVVIHELVSLPTSANIHTPGSAYAHMAAPKSLGGYGSTNPGSDGGDEDPEARKPSSSAGIQGFCCGSTPSRLCSSLFVPGTRMSTSGACPSPARVSLLLMGTDSLPFAQKTLSRRRPSISSFDQASAVQNYHDQRHRTHRIEC